MEFLRITPQQYLAVPWLREHLVKLSVEGREASPGRNVHITAIMDIGDPIIISRHGTFGEAERELLHLVARLKEKA